jgi:Na+-driven multidrug efflux pump
MLPIAGCMLGFFPLGLRGAAAGYILGCAVAFACLMILTPARNR